MTTDQNLQTSSIRGKIAVGATFITLIILYGIWYAYSVLLVALIREFAWSRSVVVGAFSVFVLVHGFLGPFIGWLIQRFGPRRLILTGGCVMAFGLFLLAETTRWWHLYLAFGVIASLGVSLGGWMPAVTLACGWFPKRIGTAIGVTSSGIGIGIFCMVPAVQLLIDHVGWRWTYRILAILLVVWVVPAALKLIRDPPVVAPLPNQTLHGSPANERRSSLQWTPGAALRSRQFWLMGAMLFTGNWVTQMLLIHQVAYLVDRGISAMTAASLGGMVGLVSIVGKVGWGNLSDRNSRELSYGMAFGFVAASVGALIMAGWYQTEAWLLAYTLFIGLGYGAMGPLPAAATSDLFGGENFPTIYGIIYAIGGVGLAAGTWSAGLIFDCTGSYVLALWLGFGMAVLSPILLWAAAPRRANPPRKD